LGLFNIIPDNFFSVLVSKNKEIYLDALFVIRKAYKHHIFIKKDDLVSMIISTLEDRLLYLEDEEVPEEKNLSSMAHFILRKLEASGWIQQEFVTSSFEDYINLNSYAIKILNLLYELINEGTKEYNQYVYSTYAALKTADENRDDYIYNALLTAYQNTEKLMDELKDLLSNIRRYHQGLFNQNEVSEVLKEHLDKFKQLISDKIIHPLKTFDSVPRFRAPILLIVKEWLIDNSVIDKLVQSAMSRRQYSSNEEAKDAIINMLTSIIDIYESIDKILQEIDKKNNIYIKASVEKVQYLLNTDRSIKGKIIELLQSRGRFNGIDMSTIMGAEVNLYEVNYVDQQSLYSNPRRRIRDPEKDIRLNKNKNNKEFKKAEEDFEELIKNSFTHDRIMQFMKKQFKERMQIESCDLRLEEIEDFVMTILGTLKHEEVKIFYSVEILKDYIFVDGYRLPKLKFIRKENIK
jgi:hypothetical protein